MLEIFRKKQQQPVNKLIEEIHESFYTEVDKLLAYAKIKHQLRADEVLRDKSSRLISVGFTSAKEVRKATEEAERLEELEEENLIKDSLVEAINYFSNKYPNYKFITEESVLKICEKYGLLYGEVKRYTGEIPDANLSHIENFKIEPEDECFLYEDLSWLQYSREYRTRSKKPINCTEASQIEQTKEISLKRDQDLHRISKLPLEIVAPVKDFDTRGMSIEGYKLVEIPDPVVLKPVVYRNTKYYLIVTAWGLEAGDDLVLNAKYN